MATKFIQIAPNDEDITIKRTNDGDIVTTDFNGLRMTFTAIAGKYTDSYLRQLMCTAIFLSSRPHHFINILKSQADILEITNINCTSLWQTMREKIKTLSYRLDTYDISFTEFKLSMVKLFNRLMTDDEALQILADYGYPSYLYY